MMSDYVSKREPILAGTITTTTNKEGQIEIIIPHIKGDGIEFDRYTYRLSPLQTVEVCWNLLQSVGYTIPEKDESKKELILPPGMSVEQGVEAAKQILERIVLLHDRAHGVSRTRQ